MYNGKWICLALFIIIILIFVPVRADQDLDSKIIEAVSEYYALDKITTEVEIRKNYIEIDPEKFDSLSIEPLTRGEPSGLLVLLVKLYDKGKEVEKGQIRVRISHFDQVLVTADKILRNEKITPAHLKRERREVTYLTNKPVVDPDDYLNCRAKKNINMGEIVTTDLIENIPLLNPGEKVNIIYEGTGFQISTRGVVLEDGYPGEVIRVKNSESNKVIACTVMDEETVHISH